jgi:hypothetical protein
MPQTPNTAIAASISARTRSMSWATMREAPSCCGKNGRVARLPPCRLPGRTARQLPDQSTTLWVESSSTGDPRLRGALPATDMLPQLWPRNWAVFYSHRLVGMPRIGQRGVERG